MEALREKIRGCAAEMASLYQQLHDSVHSQIVNWSSSQDGSGSKPEPEPEPEPAPEEDEYVTRSTVRHGHKRELDFVLRSASSSSLSRTRSKTKRSKNTHTCDGGPSARRPEQTNYPAESSRAMNVGPLTKAPTNPEDLIKSGWMDGASIKLVNDDEVFNTMAPWTRRQRLVPTPSPTPSPDDVALQEPHTPQESSAGSTSAPKRKRGLSRGLALAKAIEIGKGPLPVVWTEEANTPVGAGSSLWSRAVSKIQRQIAPKTAASWKEISDADKIHMRSLVLDKFKLPEEDPRVIHAINIALMNSHRLWRHKYHRHYLKYKDCDVLNHPHEDVSLDDWKILCERFSGPNWQKISTINTQNKAKSAVNHVSGPKSFARRRYELRDPETEELPGRLEFYKKTHFREKTQTWVTFKSQENHEKMVEIQEEAETQGLTLTQDEVVEKVLKHRSDYVQGLGAYTKPTTYSRSTATSRTSETEAMLRAEISEMNKKFDAEREEMNKKLDAEREEMNKKLEESLAASTRLEKMFMMFMEQGAYRGNTSSE